MGYFLPQINIILDKWQYRGRKLLPPVEFASKVSNLGDIDSGSVIMMPPL